MTSDLYFISQDVTEDDLRLLFSNAGGTVKAFKFFQYVHLFYSNKSHVTTEKWNYIEDQL